MQKGFANIEKRIKDACRAAGHKKIHVFYSAYPSDEEDDEPLDNLDEIAVHGKVILVGYTDEFWGGKSGKDYHSPVLENPTWLEVSVCCNAMITKTRDFHHHFLEGLNLNKYVATDARTGKPVWKIPEGVKVYEFSMGS